MRFAIHYSRAVADLVDTGEIAIDAFKCPAWPDVIAAVEGCFPIVLHFPLRVGRGTGDAIDTETRQSADWSKVGNMLAQTGTPFVNVHLEPTVADHPDSPPDTPADTTNPGDIERLTDCLIRDVQSVVQRFGPERVIAENVPNGDDC